MANFIPEDKISEIRNTVDIVNIISEAVLLKKSGRNYIGLCPFHSEKTPSFTVSPEKQIFHCFGCGKGGNVFTFLMNQSGFTFPEAVRTLANQYGVHIPERELSPGQRRSYKQREQLFTINRQALDFFCNALHKSAAGKNALAYLQKRGMTGETIAEYKIGYAPHSWDALLTYFNRKNISRSLVEKNGLIISRKNKNGFYDRFRHRIIFPIFDMNQQVIGFGGRVMDDSLPKYLNSPETPLYNKSRSLYGLHRAKNACRLAESGELPVPPGAHWEHPLRLCRSRRSGARSHSSWDRLHPPRREREFSIRRPAGAHPPSQMPTRAARARLSPIQ